MNRLFPAVVVALVLVAAAGCAGSSRPTSTPSGLAYTVTAEGTGPAATPGQYVFVHEAVTFTDGRALYSTRSGSPVRFLLGGEQVIAGVDELVTGMRVGERRVAVIPPRLSRRDSYPEGLSPDDSLHYDVELVEIEAP
jgi:FKBP-type peptidyl-prolyl cis-trans isomerase